MDLMEIIKNRRSIRKYRSDEISQQDLNEIFEAVQLAPSANNLQPWKFILIRNDKKKRLIAQACAGQEFIGEAPVVVVACAIGRGGYIGKYMESWPVDLAIAVTHLILSAWNKGLGTCWIGDFDEDKIREICSIPHVVRVVAITPLGYPVKTVPPTSRRPVERIICQESFSE